MRTLQLALAVAILVVAVGAGAQETTLFYAASASAEGANNSFWVTDARIFNPDPTATITVRLAFLASDTDNSGAEELEITIGPRQAAALDDLVGAFFELSGAGGVRLHSASPFLATSRTYNTGDGSSGTFGQFIPGLSSDEALQQGILLQVANDPADTGSRSNLGFLNPTSATVTVTYRVFDASTGMLLGEGSKELPPLAYFQVNNVFNAIGQASAVVPNATVEFMASAAMLVYASVVDNTSGDAIFVLPSADDGTPSDDNNPPEGTIVVPAGDDSALVGDAVSFSAMVGDPDDDEVTGMEWDFGDGITASGLEVIHTYSEAGQFIVTFTATDEHGLSDPTPDSRTITVTAVPAATLTQVQEQIFDQSCAFVGCHAGAAAAQGMNLSDGEAWSNTVGVASRQRPTLNRVEPFSVDDSYLWLKVNGDGVGARMPLGGQRLSDDQLDLLRSWIEGGAQDD